MKNLILTALLLVSGNAYASGSMHLPEQEWSFNSATTNWEKDTILRGYQVATEVCMSCHSMKYIKHRDLAKVGFTEGEIKQLAKNMEMTIGTPLMSAMSDADAKEVYAKALPDLSVMNKARPGGADYVYALLTGYENAPAGHTVPESASYNKYFPGHNIAMPAPLTSDGQIEYIDGTTATVEQMAKDVTYFLQWTAEPELKDRQKIGVFALLYVFLLAILLYFTKRRIWQSVKK
tara:strand:- start:83525 stop:84226 length:702 start_codon:yes stop_codon:yes gene_type:complete